jgi:FkbM family methyltransferase
MAAYALWMNQFKSWLPDGSRRFLRRLRERVTARVMHLPRYPHPIHYRPGTSDEQVIRQVLVNEEYGCLTLDRGAGLIIDCGANIGCASLYYLCKYPSVQVIAVEPDEGSVLVCRRNLAAFGDRARVIRGGVWPEPAGLRIERGGFRDGREWSYQVRPCADGEAAEFAGVTISSLLALAGGEAIDLLKIDVERAELPLFRAGYDPWLAHTRNIVIELHDRECSDTFFRALKGYDYELGASGDLTACKNVRPRNAGVST